MGKKKGAKKGAADADDFFNDMGEDVAPASAAADEEEPAPAPRKSAFAAMTLDDDDKPASDDDDEGYGGGLMAQVKKSAEKGGKKDKKKKGKKQTQDDDIWDELGEDVAGNAKAPEAADAADEFPEEPKKAGKKGKSAPTADSDDEMADAAAPTKGSGTATPVPDDDGPKILSKKEKEKLKKEKEKAKKKAQAAAKKATAGPTDEADDAVAPKKQATPEPAAAAAEPAGGDDEGDDDDAAGGADKKKKKKKKKAGDKAEAAPAAASGKKPSAAIAALQARLAAQKKAEEEARLAEEEAQRAQEEAERLEKEEEERKEAERLRKKEKEKAKRDQLKKEGKLLTPKQKAEKAAAEARMQALLRTGQVKVEGLENKADAQEKKKPVYDSKKKRKGPAGPPSKLAPAGPVEPEKEAEPEPEPEPEVVEQQPEPAAPEEEEDDDVKDDWDAESDEEEEEVKPKAAESSAAGAKKAAAPSAASAAKDKAAAASAASAKASAAAKAAQKAAEASDDEDDEDGSDDDSDDDSDDSVDDSDDDSDSDDDGLTTTQRMAAQRKADAEERKRQRKEQALAERSTDDLRSPICCILGHVDTGKTKLLDKIRQTNVQEGEAGGITQQIGATYFPVDVLKEKIAPIDPDGTQEFKTPGLLVIDTPGHESFTNLRTRGSSLCNIAVLVVDIMHGLEQQTLESIRLLRDKKTPFIVALNKIDRLYGWEATPNGGFRQSLAKQGRSTQNEFDTRLQSTIVAFAEQGLNAVPYYDNKNFSKNVSLVPTSAHTGEGIPDMLQLLVQLTQERMAASLMYLSELECTVLEVKIIEGLGTTIDVVLSNGVLREGDKIVLCGLNGAIVTQVRALLTPEPLKEMRVKGAYVHHKVVKAALGVKISAPGLEKAISGSRLLVCHEDDDEEELKDDVMSDLKDLQRWISTTGKGVCVQASTLGSLEALLEFLKSGNIPVSGIDIGPVFKGSVRRAAAMLDKGHTEYACLLCFDVTVDKEAEKLAADMGVKIFSKLTIYNLVDDYRAFADQLQEEKQREAAPTAVWPCRLKTLAVFAKRDPIILGCEIIEGDLRVGTPLCAVRLNPETKKREITSLGRVTSLEINHKPKDVVNRKEQGAGVAVRIECAVHEDKKSYGRHFDDTDEIVSMISRNSIDSLKDNFWDKVSTDQKKLIKALKPIFNIP